jgi:hypothetical protein
VVTSNGKEKHIKNNKMGYKAKSITAKASSACKMNMGLVMGAADMHNTTGFVDYGALTEEKFASGGGKAITPESETETKTETDKTKKTK